MAYAYITLFILLAAVGAVTEDSVYFLASTVVLVVYKLDQILEAM